MQRARAKLKDPRDACPRGVRFVFHRIITGRVEEFTLDSTCMIFPDLATSYNPILIVGRHAGQMVNRRQKPFDCWAAIVVCATPKLIARRPRA